MADQAKANETKKLFLDEKEKDINERQRQFELRMKETTDRFNKDKKTQEEKAANKITELERQSSDMEQRQRKLKTQEDELQKQEDDFTRMKDTFKAEKETFEKNKPLNQPVKQSEAEMEKLQQENTKLKRENEVHQQKINELNNHIIALRDKKPDETKKETLGSWTQVKEETDKIEVENCFNIKMVKWMSKNGPTESEAQKEKIQSHIHDLSPDIFSFPSNAKMTLKGYESVTELQSNATVFFKKDRLKNVSKKLSEKGIFSVFQLQGSKQQFVYCENIGDDYQVLQEKEYESLPVFISLNDQSKDPKNEDLNKSLHKSEASFMYQRKNEFKGSQTVLDYLKTDETLGYRLQIEQKMEQKPATDLVAPDGQKLADLETENKKLQSQIEILTKQSDEQYELLTKTENLNKELQKIAQENKDLNKQLEKMNLLQQQLKDIQKDLKTKEILEQKQLAEITHLKEQLNSLQEQNKQGQDIMLQKQIQDFQELETKYKMMKKKLKREKEMGQDKEQEVSKMKNEMKSREKSFLTQLEQAQSPRKETQVINTEALDVRVNELKIKNQDLENQLSKAYTQIKQQTKEVNNLNRDKESAFIQQDAILKQKNEEIEMLNRDLNNSIQDKNDFELICQDLNNRLAEQRKAENQMHRDIQDMQQGFQQKDDMLQNQVQQMNQMDNEIAGLQKQVKKAELKLRQIQQTKLKDLQRQVKKQDQEIRELKTKLGALTHGQGSLERTGSSRATSRFNNTLNRKASHSGIHTRDNRLNSNPINEVDERLENTGRFDDEYDLRGGQYQTDTQSLAYENTIASRGYRQNRQTRHNQTPQLPSIHGSKFNDMYQETGGMDTKNKRFLSAQKIKPNKEIRNNYNYQFDSYDQKRKNTNFNNHSSGIGGVLQSGTKTRSPSKQEQSIILEQKMNKIDHILENSYSLY